MSSKICFIEASANRCYSIASIRVEIKLSTRIIISTSDSNRPMNKSIVGAKIFDSKFKSA